MATVNLACISDRGWFKTSSTNVSYAAAGAACIQLSPGTTTGVHNVLMTFGMSAYASKQIDRAILYITIDTYRQPDGTSPLTGTYPGSTMFFSAYGEPVYAETINSTQQISENARAGAVTCPYYASSSAQTLSVDITALVVSNIYDGLFNVIFYQPDTAATSTTVQYPIVYTRESSYVPYIALTYSDYVPQVVTAYPKETYAHESDSIDFNWTFSCQSGSTLAHSRVEISTDGTTFAMLAEIDGSDTHLTVTDGITAGTVYWRVTVTDSLGATAVSDIAKFTVIGKPAAPIIVSISNDARPVIRWNATDQMGYRIAVYCGGVAIESEDVSKSDKVYYCKEFYPNGNIEIRLSIQSVYELWSDESTRIATIDAAVPETPDITVSIVDCNAVVTTAATGNLYLYRTCDGETVRIGTVTDGEFIDKTIPGGLPCAYFIRKYDGGYADSEEITVEVDIRGIIIDCGEIRVTASRSTEQFMMLDETTGRDMVIANYSGRAYPCIEVGEHKTQTIARKFFIDNANYQKLRKIHVSGDIMTYRDRDGNVMDCIISGTLTASRSRILAGYDIQATFSRVEGV